MYMGRIEYQRDTDNKLTSFYFREIHILFAFNDELLDMEFLTKSDIEAIKRIEKKLKQASTPKGRMKLMEKYK